MMHPDVVTKHPNDVVKVNASKDGDLESLVVHVDVRREFFDKHEFTFM